MRRTKIVCTLGPATDDVEIMKELIRNGLDAARTIREMKRRDARRVPIIAMSANSFAEDIINSRLAGMNVHLAKPLDAEKMIIALKQCMADNSDVKLHEDL